MDAYCMVCGEPWDVYNDKADMELWQFRLFRKGAGCPACKGEIPKSGKFEPNIFQLELGEEYTIDRIETLTNEVKIEWKKPDPALLWQCEGCGVKIVRDANDELDYEEDNPGKQWYHSHPYYRMELTEEPYHTFHEDRHVCEFCYCTCDKCDADVSYTLDADIYDDGWCGRSEYTDGWFCIDCIDSECHACCEMECRCDEIIASFDPFEYMLEDLNDMDTISKTRFEALKDEGELDHCLPYRVYLTCENTGPWKHTARLDVKQWDEWREIVSWNAENPDESHYY